MLILPDILSDSDSLPGATYPASPVELLLPGIPGNPDIPPGIIPGPGTGGALEGPSVGAPPVSSLLLLLLNDGVSEPLGTMRFCAAR